MMFVFCVVKRWLVGMVAALRARTSVCTDGARRRMNSTETSLAMRMQSRFSAARRIPEASARRLRCPLVRDAILVMRASSQTLDSSLRPCGSVLFFYTTQM